MDRASKISLLELYRPEPSTIKTKGHTLLKDASVNKVGEYSFLQN